MAPGLPLLGLIGLAAALTLRVQDDGRGVRP